MEKTQKVENTANKLVLKATLKLQTCMEDFEIYEDVLNTLIADKMTSLRSVLLKHTEQFLEKNNVKNAILVREILNLAQIWAKKDQKVEEIAENELKAEDGKTEEIEQEKTAETEEAEEVDQTVALLQEYQSLKDEIAKKIVVSLSKESFKILIDFFKFEYEEARIDLCYSILELVKLVLSQKIKVNNFQALLSDEDKKLIEIVESTYKLVIEHQDMIEAERVSRSAQIYSTINSKKKEKI